MKHRTQVFRTLKVRFSVVMFALAFCGKTHGQIYKYQDAQGRWQFTDQKPKTAKQAEQVEKVTLSSQPKRKTLRVLSITRTLNADQTRSAITATNLIHAPLDCTFDLDEGETERFLLAVNQQQVIFNTDNIWLQPKDIAFSCVAGDPKTIPHEYPYLVPFKGFKSLRVTQGFHGGFSHFNRPQRFAVDIGMDVGTPISAARGGIVMDLKDDYAYSGVSSAFFLDKANFVQVLHDDGTYALYGHLLIGKVLVKRGERVETGQLIGYSGNTGFSTGPHLHFVIQYNDKGRTISHPFQFRQNDGTLVTPTRGMWLNPVE